MFLIKDRKHAIEASIVRVMKSRQRLEHRQLLAEVKVVEVFRKVLFEVSHQLLRHFTPEPKHIKARIEHLIALDYMKRDEDNRNVYIYVA